MQEKERELIKRELERAEKLLRELGDTVNKLYRLGALNEFMLGQVDAAIFTLRRILEKVAKGEFETPPF